MSEMRWVGKKSRLLLTTISWQTLPSCGSGFNFFKRKIVEKKKTTTFFRGVYTPVGGLSGCNTARGCRIKCSG